MKVWVTGDAELDDIYVNLLTGGAHEIKSNNVIEILDTTDREMNF